MFLLVLLITIKPISLTDTSETNCDDEAPYRKHYKTEVLYTNLNEPCNLVLDTLTNMLFFRQTVNKGTYKEYRKITVCHIDSKYCRDIKSIKGTYALAYDSKRYDVYIGGRDGIYRYNFSSGITDFFAEKGKIIRDICVGKSFYYVQNPSQRLFVFKDGKFIKVKEAKNIEIDHFHISSSQNIYYSNNTGLFKVNNDSKVSSILSYRIPVMQIAENQAGEVYFAAKDGIFVENKNFAHLDAVTRMEGVCGLTFDGNDHPIIAKNSIIFRLIPSKTNRTCEKGKQNLKEPNLRKALIRKNKTRID